MVLKLYHLILCVLVGFANPSYSADFEPVDPELGQEEQLIFRSTKQWRDDEICSRVHTNSKDIVRRIYAIMPYFDRERLNTEFLHKLRGTIHGMSAGENLLDHEAAFYAAVLIPLVFLQQHRDTWCLLERVQVLVSQLPGLISRPRTTTPTEPEDGEHLDEKDIKYAKELIKNFG